MISMVVRHFAATISNLSLINMLLIYFILFIISLPAFNGQSTSLSDESFHKAALDVISLHRPSIDPHEEDHLHMAGSSKTHQCSKNDKKRSAFPSNDVPHLDASPHFMHSYIPFTGVGNREEIFIDGIHEENLAVRIASRIIGWKYMRYNSTDFVMAYQDHHLDVWRMQLTRDVKDFVFDHKFTFCNVDLRSEEKVMETIFYTKLIQHVEVLFFAATIETPVGYQLRAYEVTFGECVPVLTINLKNNRPINIGFVSSQYNSAIVLLYEGGDGNAKLVHKKNSHDEHTKVIEVSSRNAVDLDTFTINGFGYIAVANAQGCDVFRLSEFINDHILFDHINQHGIVDIKAFRLGFDHFIGIATRGNTQFLYIWHGGSFYPKQNFTAESVIQWNTVEIPTCRDDVLLFLYRFDRTSPVHIYLWNGQTREFQLAVANIRHMIPYNYSVSPFSQAAFSYDHTAYVLEVDQAGVPHMISIKTRLGRVDDPVVMRGLHITDMMSQLKDRFDFHQEFINKVSGSLKHAVRSNSPNQFTQPQIFQTLHVLKDAITKNIRNIPNIIWKNSPLNLQDLRFKISDLQRDTSSITQLMAALRNKMPDVVLRSKPTIITGHKTILGPIRLAALNASSLQVNTIGHHSVQQLLEKAYRLGQSRRIGGKKIVMKPTLVKGSINANFVNGMDLKKQVVTINENQLISGPIKFNSPLTITHDLMIEGKLNGLNIDEDIVYLNKSSLIRAPKVFTSPVTIAHGVISGLIDGVNLTHLVRNALFTTGKQMIRGRKIITGSLTSKCITVDGLVNGIKIAQLANELVYIDKPSNVTGRKTFLREDVFIKNDLIVNRKLNGKRIPDDLLLPRSTQTITAQKYFTGLNIFEEQVVIRGLIDRLRLPEDVVTLTMNETIMGPVIINDGINVNKNIHARQLVDEIDISDLNLRALKIFDNQIHGNVRFRHPVKASRLDIEGYINGINLLQVFQDAIFTGTPNVTITGSKRFMGHVEMEELFAHRINGFNISEFATTFKNETIRGNVSFQGHSSFTNAIVSGLLDNVHIGNLFYDRISLSKNEDVFGVKTFSDVMNVTQPLRVNGTMGGILPQVDLVLKSKPGQEIVAAKTLTRNLFTTNLKVSSSSSVLVNGKIDNVNIRDIDARRVRLNSNQTLSSRVVLINCNASHIEVSGKVNDINITHFAMNVMSISRSQTVFAPKWFRGNQMNAWMNTSKGVNAINLRLVNEKAFHLNGINEVIAPYSFTHDLTLERPLFVNGLINGINLTGLALDAVYKTGPSVITGSNQFRFGFFAQNDINTRHVNGIDLSRQILTKTRDHIMNGKVTFTNSLNINRNVSVNGFVNGIDLSVFNRRVMKKNQLNRVIGNLEFNGPHTLISDLRVAGLVNTINLTSLFNDALMKHGNQDVFGTKVFNSHVKFSRKVDALFMNGFTTQHLLHDIVFAHSPHEQIIRAPKTFKSDFSAFNGMQQINGTNNILMINGVNLMVLVRESIRTNKPNILNGVRFFRNTTIITGNVTRLNGRVNGIDLMHDVIHTTHHLATPQVIFGKKTFSNLILMEDLAVDGLVNGFPLQSLAVNTLYTSGNQRIEGRKMIPGLLIMSRGNNIVQTLNGMKVPDNLVSLNGNQTIYGGVLFNNTVNAYNNIRADGLISGVNLGRFMNESMFKDISRTMQIPFRMDNAVFRNDVNVAGHVDNVDLSALSRDAWQFTNVLNISKELMLHTLNRHEYITRYLYKVLERSTFEIDRFVFHQQLDGVYGDHIDINGDTGVMAISSHYNLDVTTFTLKYNPISHHFESHLKLGFSPFHDRKFFRVGPQEYVIYLSASHNVSSQLFIESRMVGSLGFSISDVQVLVIAAENAAFIFALNMQGVITVYHLTTNNQDVPILVNLGVYQVAKGIAKMKPFMMNNQIYLAIGRVMTSSCMVDDAGSLLFIWQNRRHFKLLQRFPISASHVVHYQDDTKHYLVFNDVDLIEMSQEHQSVYIYRTSDFNDCYFSVFQKLHINKNARQLSSFKFGTLSYPQQFLYVVSESALIIWKQEGESGFKSFWKLPIGDAKVVKLMLTGGRLFIIVGRDNDCHHSLVFRAEMKGVSITPIVLMNN